MAHFDIEAAHHRPPHDVFLILRLGALHLYRAPARATPRQRRWQYFIHAMRHRPERWLPKVAAALRPGVLGSAFAPLWKKAQLGDGWPDGPSADPALTVRDVS